MTKRATERAREREREVEKSDRDRVGGTNKKSRCERGRRELLFRSDW